jgi:hypothetical protein
MITVYEHVANFRWDSDYDYLRSDYDDNYDYAEAGHGDSRRDVVAPANPKDFDKTNLANSAVNASHDEQAL